MTRGDDMAFDVMKMCAAARAAAPSLARLSGAEKNRALLAVREALSAGAETILASNAGDLEKAERGGMSGPLKDRLRLTPRRLADICRGLEELTAMPDPVGVIKGGHVADNGLEITSVTVPIGVIAVIYEARPNVGPDAAGLCLKSGNVCVLRGGKEAYSTNLALVTAMRKALEDAGFDPDYINFVDSVSREDTLALMSAEGYIDCVIPRGGAGLIRAVRGNCTVPVIETGAGICHIYVDRDADTEKAVSITENAKTSRPGVCNAAETLLVHSAVARTVLPRIKEALDRHRVQLRCCPRALAALGGEGGGVTAAVEADYDTEFDDLIMSVRVVDSEEEAIAHINAHGTRHSDAIISENAEACGRFLREVDSAAVYANASTRFTDGGCFGLGAEIGISTQKLHARGPMGLGALTSIKYLIRGNGQIRI